MSDSASDPGSITNPVKFKNQDFVSLCDECLKSSKLFVDTSFPADQNSIGMPADPDPKMVIKWLRPKEISSNAVFVEGTTGTTDICQGQLGNCWLLAALSCLTMHPTLFEKVVPSGQTMDASSYAGIFRFRFWQYGEWVEVVVDDRLPVRGGRLLFSYSRTKNEFWSALVEKAYAKLSGSYSSLKGGNISEGMEDFTGGIAYTRPVSSRTPPVLWRTLTAALSRGSLLSCFIQAKSVKEIGSVSPEGLVRGHAYAITATDKVHKKTETEEVLLVRLRNPWGFVEYCGPWGDKCKDWDGIEKAEKTRIKLNIEEDGEFWIGVQDFCKLFDTVELCSVNPDSDAGEEGSDSSWSLTSHKGSWVPMCSAGGSRKNPKTFCKNPQFHLILSQQDAEDVEIDEDELDAGDDDNISTAAPPKSSLDKHKEKMKKCTVLIELLQKHRRFKDKVNFLFIGYHIYKLPPELQDSTGSFNQEFFDTNPLVGRSGMYRNVRAVWRKVHLDPGHYIIVTSTQRPNQPGEFFLRIYAKNGHSLGVRDISCSAAISMTVMSEPPSAEEQRMVQTWFDEKAGPDDKLNAMEFMKLVNSVLEKDYHVPLETCRQLVFTQNTEGRGRLSRDQAHYLLSSLRRLQSIFLEYDEDSSGSISPFELSQALKAAGVQCDNNILHMLWERFGSGEQQLPFYIFVSCVTRLQVLFALFESENSPEVKSRGINTWLLRLLAV